MFVLKSATVFFVDLEVGKNDIISATARYPASKGSSPWIIELAMVILDKPIQPNFRLVCRVLDEG